MSCEENEKILVCTKLYKIIKSYDTTEEKIYSTTLTTPILCQQICPDSYIEKTFDPNKTSQYVTNIVESCEECLSSYGCEKNQAIFFNKNTCSLEEYEVISETSANEMETDGLILVDFIRCLSIPLSRSSPIAYNQILSEQQTLYPECLTACCYKLDNNSVGCLNIPASECTIDAVRQKLNSTSVVEVSLSEILYQKCSDTNCFDSTQSPNFENYSSKIMCGACCINNNCKLICDSNKESLKDYIANILNLQPNNIDEILLSNLDNIDAKTICLALQGEFLGYDTSCADGLCLKYKTFIQ